VNRAKAWLVASRPFIIPFWLAGTAMGVAFAGWDTQAWLAASFIVVLIGLSAHYINNWRDYTKGLDKLEEGSKPKVYTAANQILPTGILSVEDMQMAAVFCLVIAFIIAGVFLRRIDQILMFLAGLTAAIGYTDFFKPKGFGEIALFLGHGGVAPFAYTLVKPFDVTALGLWVINGMTIALLYTIDQLPDVETDFMRRVKSLAYYVMNAEIRPSQIIWFAASAVTVLSVCMVVLGWMPKEIIYIAFTLPLWHICGIVIDNDFEKGVFIGLIGYFLIMVIPTVALLL